MRPAILTNPAILIGLLSLLCGSALACAVMPKKLVRPHAEVVDEAKQIFLAEVVGSQPVHRVVQAFEPVIYRLTDIPHTFYPLSE